VKYIQVIDGAENCVYDVFAASDEDYSLLFPNRTDIGFAEDFDARSDASAAAAALERLWLSRVPKAQAQGIHGLLFFGLPGKRQYYPTLRDEEAINPDGTGLRR
jgi:hypothetical protein